MRDDTKLSAWVRRLRTDQRARVPLALVGVLLLLTSATIVGYVGTRSAATPDVDAGIAIDRTEAVAQTAVRDGTQRATELAAEQPLTEPADNEWGDVLRTYADDADGWAPIHPRLGSDGSTLPNDAFEAYLRALIYLEVNDRLATAGQEVGDVETAVSLPPVEDSDAFAAAIDRVTLSAPEAGVLDVTLENVTLTATRDGAVIEERETTINVSVATPIVQLHKRVETFQAALDAGVTERGFSQRFNARIYALGWARGWAQNYRAPIVEVIANRHVEPSVNSALYRTQQDVFGAADPNLGNAVRLGWVCMGLQDGKAMFDEYVEGVSYGNLSYNHADGTVSYGNYSAGVPSGDVAESLCDRAQFLFGDRITGEHPEPPAVEDLLGNAPGMNSTETIAVGESARVPLAGMVANGSDANSFERAIERIFTIEGTVNTTVELYDPLVLETACSEGDGTSDVSRNQRFRQVQYPTNETLSNPGEYYEFTATVVVSVEETRECSDGSYENTDQDTFRAAVTTTVSEHDASPNATIEDVNPNLGVEYAYERGPDSPTEGETVPHPDFRNYAGAGELVTTGLLGGTATRDYEQWVDDRLSGVTDPQAVDGTLTTGGTVTIDHEEFLNVSLAATLVEDVTSIQQEVANITHQFNRTEILATGSESPYAVLLDRVEAEIHETYLERDQPYENVGQKAVYEARDAYLDVLVAELERFNETHRAAISGIDDTMGDVDSSLDDALTYLQQGVSGSEPDPVELPASNLTGDVTYEVSASPTYLVGTNVTRERVTAVERNRTFAPLAMKNTNHLKLPYDAVVDGIIATLANALGLGEPDAELSFRMAGDALLAGELAVEANATDPKNRLAGSESFEGRIAAFRANVNESLQAFHRELAKETVIELYPSPLAECVVLEDISDPRLPSGLGEPTCGEIRASYSDELESKIRTASDEIAASARETLTVEYDSVAQRALKIGNGNATKPLLDGIRTALDGSEHRYGRFDERFDPAQWSQVVQSAARPALVRASSTKVEVGDVDDAEQIDGNIQAALTDVSRQILEERLDELGAYALEEYENWVGNWNGNRVRPARVPAGLPLLPIPGKWVATVNAWDVEVAGAYARFAVTSNVGTPEEMTATTYVRENRTVTREIAGGVRTLGRVEPIAFSGRSHLVVVVDPGVGVGDRGDANPECSATYPVVGYVGPNDTFACQTFPSYGLGWTEPSREQDGGT